VNGVYKLVEIDGIPVMKQSSGKITYPGRKQIFRTFVEGKVKSDRLGLADESTSTEQPLLELMVKEGKRMRSSETIAEIRQRTSASVASLPEETRQLNHPVSVHVEISAELEKLTQQTQKLATKD
jgi:nicotinate phosphoribosyltransferase